MREIAAESSWRKRGVFFKALTVVVVLFVVSTQLFVVWNMQQKFAKTDGVKKSGEIAEKPTPKPKKVSSVPETISEVLERLPTPTLNQFQFESDVMRPHKDMLEKFPAHPSMIITKLAKIVEKEEEKSRAIVREIEKVRETFGLPPRDSGKPSVSPGARHLASLNYEPALPVCPAQPPGLLGPLIVRSDVPEAELTMEAGSDEWRKWYGPLGAGGAFKPEECTARQKVAIIVPYRDRSDHLRLFLRHMHPLLQRQQLDYQIFVVEQAGSDAFNRAALMNVGYSEASERAAFDCFVFHDVDLVPEDDRNLYTCPKDMPKHLAVAVNKWKYRLIYGNYFGGVSALSKEQFENVNGFSNSFYGWGGEDDDLFHRVEKKGYPVFRYPGNIGRYSMLKHDKVDMNENLDSMMELSKMDMLTADGLSTMQYKKINEKMLPTHTWILAKLPPPPPKKQPSSWDTLKSSLWNGMSQVGGGVASSISDRATEVATRKQRQRDREVDRVY
jgi:hypothetical protein